jgi:hypothetical protein
MIFVPHEDNELNKFGDVDACKLSVSEGDGRLQGNNLLLNGNYVIVRAEGENHVFDQIVIRRKNLWAFLRLKLRQDSERKKLKL